MDLFVEKYRPQDLNGFVGDDTVRTKIQEYLKTGKLQNLLLFGPAGTGKTSLAKLNSRAIRCRLPLHQCLRRKRN